MQISKKDVQILQQLAKRYMEYATASKNQEKRELWFALNNLNMKKPMVAIDQIPWKEFDGYEELRCRVENSYFRMVEWQLRTQMFKWQYFPADMVLNPYIELPLPIQNTGFGVTIGNIEHTSDANILSQRYIDNFEEMVDVQKIKTPQISLDTTLKQEIFDIAAMIFDGIAPLKWRGMMLHCGLWDHITFWKGVENCYIDLLERPELIHAIMDRFTNAYLGLIDQINTLGVYDVTGNMCHCSYTFSDKLPDKRCDYDFPTTHDGWTFSMAQLFTSVSPDINVEFEVPYMSKIFSKFGAVYYGCCERLDDRLDIVSKMPNIRKISCSPWSDRKKFAEKLPKHIIMSNKPNPSFLAGTNFDEEIIRKDLRQTIRLAKENNIGLELLLKDLGTVQGDVNRLTRWSEIAMEETINATI